MFPFSPSRTAAALLELADAMLAPNAFEPAIPASDLRTDSKHHSAPHPHRRAATLERHRRPAPPTPEQACLTPLTRAARARAAQRI
jgi:hypothetical protein